jgi:hypothetical protein
LPEAQVIHIDIDPTSIKKLFTPHTYCWRCVAVLGDECDSAVDGWQSAEKAARSRKLGMEWKKLIR